MYHPLLNTFMPVYVPIFPSWTLSAQFLTTAKKEALSKVTSPPIDFCMGHPRDWNDIVYRLHGKIYLILGNHDMKNIKGGCMQRFELVTRQMSIRVGGHSIILNHNPFLCYGGSYRDVRQLFCHVHSGPLSHTGLDHPRLNMLFPTLGKRNYRSNSLRLQVSQ